MSVVIIMFLFGANVKNTPNKKLFDRARERYRATREEGYLLLQSAEGEVTLTHKDQVMRYSQKGCLSSKQVIDQGIKLLNQAKISPQNCRFLVVSHKDHNWPLMILRKLGFDANLTAGISEYAGHSEPQRRCRSRFLFLIYRALVLTHHRLKRWI